MCSAGERLFLPSFACGVFGVACGLLISLERRFRLGLRGAFGLPPRILFCNSLRLPVLLGVAQRLLLLSGGAFDRLALRRSNLARRCGFHPLSVMLGGLCAFCRRGRPDLFELGLLRLGGSLQSFDEIGFFPRHVLNPSSGRVRGFARFDRCRSLSLFQEPRCLFSQNGKKAPGRLRQEPRERHLNAQRVVHHLYGALGSLPQRAHVEAQRISFPGLLLDHYQGAKTLFHLPKARLEPVDGLDLAHTMRNDDCDPIAHDRDASIG